MKIKHMAFTTVEILLAMLIIGIIAAMTIMVLIPDTQGKEQVVKLQKAYSVLSNAYENTSAKFGNITEWDNLSSSTFAHIMGDAMHVAKNCGVATNLTDNNECMPGCPKIYTTTKTLLDICTSGSVSKIKTQDGYSYAFQIESANCDINITDNSAGVDPILKMVCGTAMTDLNSSSFGKNKNIYGKDLFLFYITRDGIYPAGIQDDAKFGNYDASKCKKIVSEHIPGCTATFLYYNNSKITE